MRPQVAEGYRKIFSTTLRRKTWMVWYTIWLDRIST